MAILFFCQFSWLLSICRHIFVWCLLNSMVACNAVAETLANPRQSPSTIGHQSAEFTWTQMGSTEAQQSSVAAQFEKYPYPAVGSNKRVDSSILKPNQYPRACLHVLSILNRTSGTIPHNRLRILIAGGGTGGRTEILAKSCMHIDVPTSIIHLDISMASIAHASSLSTSYPNIKFVHGSILEATEESLGLFDYIQCYGVLHHIPDMEKAFSRLVKLLNPHGALHVWIGSAYTQEDSHRVHSVVADILGDGFAACCDKPEEASIDSARSLLLKMPRRSGPHFFPLGVPDATIVDSLLFATRHRTSIEEVYRLAESNGARVAMLAYEGVYKPERLAGEVRNVFEPLQSAVDASSIGKRYHFTEKIRSLTDEEDPFDTLLEGAHEFWVARKDSLVGRPKSLSTDNRVMCSRSFPSVSPEALESFSRMLTFPLWWFQLTVEARYGKRKGRKEISVVPIPSVAACWENSNYPCHALSEGRSLALFLPLARVQAPPLPAFVITFLAVAKTACDKYAPLESPLIIELVDETFHRLVSNWSLPRRLSQHSALEFTLINKDLHTCVKTGRVARECIWSNGLITSALEWLLEIAYDLDWFFLL